MFEPQHRTTPAFDVPVILLNDVVEIFALTDLDTLVVVIIVVSRIAAVFAPLLSMLIRPGLPACSGPTDDTI
jgi:hypothetical protein